MFVSIIITCLKARTKMIDCPMSATAFVTPFALKASYNYFSELLEGECFFVDISILDFDSKRVHLFGEMRKEKSLELSAVFETVLMNMDLSGRKVKHYPDRVLSLFSLFKSSLVQSNIPIEIGKKISLKK